MNLHQLAKDAGVRVERCSGEWGGTWAYRMADAPNVAYCGYRSERACYKAWLEDTFGKSTAKAIMDLLRRAK